MRGFSSAITCLLFILALSCFNTACGTTSPPKVSCATDQERAAFKTSHDAWVNEVMGWNKESIALAFEIRLLEQYPHWPEMAEWFKGEVGRQYLELGRVDLNPQFLAVVYWAARWETNGPEVYKKTLTLVRQGFDLKSKRNDLGKAGLFAGQRVKFAMCPSIPIAEQTRLLEGANYLLKTEGNLLKMDEMAIIDEFLQMTGFCPVGAQQFPVSARFKGSSIKSVPRRSKRLMGACDSPRPGAPVSVFGIKRS